MFVVLNWLRTNSNGGLLIVKYKSSGSNIIEQISGGTQ
jgi:hypothetical protein